MIAAPLPPELERVKVTVRGADTSFTPYDRSTGASRSTTLAGLAVQRAAADVRGQLERIAASSEIDSGEILELMRRHFGFAGGELIGRGDVAPTGTGSYVWRESGRAPFTSGLEESVMSK